MSIETESTDINIRVSDNEEFNDLENDYWSTNDEVQRTTRGVVMVNCDDEMGFLDESENMPNTTSMHRQKHTDQRQPWYVLLHIIYKYTTLSFL